MRLNFTKLFAGAVALAWTTESMATNAVTAHLSPLSRSLDHIQSDDSTQRRLRTINGADEERFSRMSMAGLRRALELELKEMHLESVATNQLVVRICTILGIEVAKSTPTNLNKLAELIKVEKEAENVAKKVQNPVDQADVILGLLIYPVKQGDVLGNKLLEKWPLLPKKAIINRFHRLKNHEVPKEPQPFAAHVHAPVVVAH